MGKFTEILDRINALKIDYSNISDRINMLHDQFNMASLAQYSKEELNNIIIHDFNVLDSQPEFKLCNDIHPDSKLFDIIESIQKDIINFFGE